MIDVTDIDEVKVGDEVILLGEEGNLKFNADDFAEIMGIEFIHIGENTNIEEFRKELFYNDVAYRLHMN